MDYAAFWHVYLRAHARPLTRGLHYAGTLLGLGLLLAGLAWNAWLLAAAPVVGYAFAWIGHFGVEGNKPATFGHPLWSFCSDVRMLVLFLTGRLGPHLAAAGVTPSATHSAG